MANRIERVEVYGVAMPLVEAFASAKGPKNVQKSAVVRVLGKDGATGIGSVEPILSASWTETTEDVLEIIQKRLVPVVIGVDATNINELRAALDAASPAISNARVPIEMACVDLTARCMGVSVATYLGGAITEVLEFNAWIGLLEPANAAKEARRWYDKGFRSTKIKLGGDIPTDYARVAAVREAVGTSMALRIDANESYEADAALELARMLRSFNIQHFEQPARRDDLAGLARVRRFGGVPVMVDESITDHASLIDVIKAEAADIVKLGVKEQGGVHRMRELISTAEAAGMRCVVGHGFGLTPSTLAEMAVAATSRNVIPGLECVGPLKTRDTITHQQLDISSGRLTLPQTLGFGLELDEAKLRRYALDS